MTKVEILMASYNGMKYISHQIDSIINQSYGNWNLLISDDGSTDGTKEVLKQYVRKDPRISVSFNEFNIGVVKNFEKLLMDSRADYVMFSDQDDIWFKNKIKISLEKIQKIDQSGSIPYLVHADACVVNSELKVLNKTFIGNKGLRVGITAMMFYGIAQGATIIMNRKLVHELLPFPEGLNMYDYYAACVSEIRGKRSFISEPLMLYRQHEKNVLGAGLSKKGRLEKIFAFFSKASNSLTEKKHYEDVKLIFSTKLQIIKPSTKKLFIAFFRVMSKKYFFLYRICYIWKFNFFTFRERISFSLKIAMGIV